jgi:hypothetical protein
MQTGTPQKQSKQKRRGRPRGKPLRGQKLVKAAHAVLARMVTLSPKTDPINIAQLAARLQITRQAIYDNGLKGAVAEHAELQRKNFATEVEAAVSRRPLEERIAALEKENEELRRKLDGWIERWASVEYNAKMHGLNADQLFAPMPPPQRNALAMRNRADKR